MKFILAQKVMKYCQRNFLNITALDDYKSFPVNDNLHYNLPLEGQGFFFPCYPSWQYLRICCIAGSNYPGTNVVICNRNWTNNYFFSNSALNNCPRSRPMGINLRVLVLNLEIIIDVLCVLWRLRYKNWELFYWKTSPFPALTTEVTSKKQI